MDNKTRIHYLKNIFENIELTDEEKVALESAIEILKNNTTKEQLIEVAKIFAALLNVGVKMFH